MTETLLDIIHKRQFGIFDRRDQIQFSSELISTMNYLAEHNPIGFFILINRNDLIRDLFPKVELNSKLHALIRKFEHKRKESKYQRTRKQGLEQVKKLVKSTVVPLTPNKNGYSDTFFKVPNEKSSFRKIRIINIPH